MYTYHYFGFILSLTIALAAYTTAGVVFFLYLLRALQLYTILLILKLN